MSYDSLVDEVRAIREAYAARFDYDPDAICRDLREQARKSGRKLVKLPPKRCVPVEMAPASQPVRIEEKALGHHQERGGSMTENWRSLITIEPGKRSGRPCIRGMRITVFDVLSYLAAGMTHEEILEDFPYLTAADIHACLAYAAERERQMLVVTA